MSRPATVADVLDHRFGPGPALTVGVEEEFMLLDAESFDLVASCSRRSAAISPSWCRPSCSSRWSSSTRRCARAWRTRSASCAVGARMPLPSRRPRACGSPPPARIRSACSSASGYWPRARSGAHRRVAVRARRELIFGLHVHVAVDDPDRAVRLIGALQAHFCELVALSASSPFWRGQPTGLASCRHLIFAAFPRSGPSPPFRSYEEFAGVVAELVACGCIED